MEKMAYKIYTKEYYQINCLNRFQRNASMEEIVILLKENFPNGFTSLDGTTFLNRHFNLEIVNYPNRKIDSTFFKRLFDLDLLERKDLSVDVEHNLYFYTTVNMEVFYSQIIKKQILNKMEDKK